jgi:hypothetical protein
MHRSKQHLYILPPRLREQPAPLGRAGELDELFGQAAKTGAIGKARKAARKSVRRAVRDRRPASVSSLAHPATSARR